MLDLKKRQKNLDLRKYVFDLEQVIINSLRDFGIITSRRDGRIGIWTDNQATESKIAAIGIRVRKWVAYHGIAINIRPDLSKFNNIIPCGIKEFGVTSLLNEDVDISLETFDEIFKENFNKIFCY